jgi:hypothetical protein
MKWRPLLEGLQILDKYIDDDSYATSVAHDVLYAGPEAAGKINDEDRKRLEELGWSFDDEVDSFYAFT